MNIVWGPNLSKCGLLCGSGLPCPIPEIPAIGTVERPLGAGEGTAQLAKLKQLGSGRHQPAEGCRSPPDDADLLYVTRL